MTIQDAHTHFFSRPFFETLATLSPRQEDNESLLTEVADATGIEIPSADVDAHTDRWLEQMGTHGVERMVTFASLPTEAEAVAQAARRARGRLLPYTLVDPTAETATSFVERAFGELGFRGLLTFPAMHHFLPDDHTCHDIYAMAQASSAPVIVHCGILSVKLRDLLGLPRPYDLSFANPLSLVPAANRFPDVTFVVPHFGGGFLREVLMLGMQCENVYVDTSSSNDWVRSQPGGMDLADVFSDVLDVFGAERILFGTDSSTFPRGYRADIRDQQLAALGAASASAEQIERIMGGNLARLLPAMQPS
jgi:predicted TIM-barrel fold metal-dependent hydrolase